MKTFHDINLADIKNIDFKLTDGESHAEALARAAGDPQKFVESLFKMAYVLHVFAQECRADIEEGKADEVTQYGLHHCEEIGDIIKALLGTIVPALKFAGVNGNPGAAIVVGPNPEKVDLREVFAQEPANARKH